MGIARGPTSQDDMNRNLPKDTNMNRYNKPAQTPVGGAEMAKPAFNRQTQREMTTAAEVGRKLSDLTEPSLYQGSAVEAEGAVTGATLSTPHRCCDCGIRITAGRDSVTDGDECRELRPSITCQMVPKTAPLTDTGRRQYRLKSQAFVGNTDIQNARMLLEVPALRMPNVFLELAEEARKSVMVDDQLTDRKDVQSHRTGQAKPVFVTEILNSTPVLGSRSSRVTNTSTEMTPDRNLDQPMIGSGPVDRMSNTGQLDVKMKQGASGPIGPVGHDVLLTGRLEMVARPDPVGPHSRPEQSVSLRFDADQEEHYPTHGVHPGVKMFRAQPVADGPAGPDRTRRPVGTDEMYATHDDVRPTAGGPVGRFPVPGPLKYSKISSPDDSYQPLFTGPLGTNEMIAMNDQSRPAASGPLGRQCSLDPMGPRAKLSLGDRNQPPSVGPVGRLWLSERPGEQVTESDFRQTTQTRSESESETGVTDSVIRTESDAQTDRANICMTNGPTDSNVISSSSDAAVHSLGERLIQTKIVSESVAGRPVPVIQTECEVQIDRVNIGIANGPTDPSVTPPSSDSGIHSLGEQWENMSANSMSTESIQTVKTFYGGAMNRDRKNPQENRKVASFVRTVYGKNDSIDYSTADSQNSDIAAMSDFSDDEDGEVQTDRVNIGIANGPTDSSVTPPSSDSGVHSLGEQWENMSTNSMNTGSIQTVKTFYGGVVSQVDSKNQESLKMVFCSGTVCGKKDSMAYSTTDSQNSDIAAMSDFSDDEEGPQGELRPKILTECVSDDSIKEESNNCERSDPDMTTAGVGSKYLDPNDKEYWTKFRLLTRQAFLLDNVKLSESDYPDAVKEIVTRSRLTVIEFNKGEDQPLEQYNEGEMSDDSDADSTINMYKSKYDHNLEDYRDWHYDRAPIVPDVTADDDIGTVRNADNNDGQCRAVREGNEVGTDEHSEPGGRARSELSSEKTVRLIDTFGVNLVINDDITVNIRDSTGASHMQDDEIRMVSMITVDVSQGHTN